MSKSKEYEAREIADMVGGRIEQTTLDDGTHVKSIETDDQAVVGSDLDENEAWADLVDKADEVGWRLGE